LSPHASPNATLSLAKFPPFDTCEISRNGWRTFRKSEHRFSAENVTKMENPEPGFDSIKAGKALARRPFAPRLAILSMQFIHQALKTWRQGKRFRR
jgi:hypothetical protein